MELTRRNFLSGAAATAAALTLPAAALTLPAAALALSEPAPIHGVCAHRRWTEGLGLHCAAAHFEFEKQESYGLRRDSWSWAWDLQQQTFLMAPHLTSDEWTRMRDAVYAGVFNQPPDLGARFREIVAPTREKVYTVAVHLGQAWQVPFAARMLRIMAWDVRGATALDTQTFTNLCEDSAVRLCSNPVDYRSPRSLT